MVTLSGQARCLGLSAGPLMSERWTVEFGRMDSETRGSACSSRECVMLMQWTRRRGIFKVGQRPNSGHLALRKEPTSKCAMCKGSISPSHQRNPRR